MTQTTLLEKALTKVKENGFKYTKKRETLLDYLIKSNRYVSAREVYNHMNGQFPGLSYDTVYRNLREFCEIGLIEDTELQGEMKFRFSAVKILNTITILFVQFAEKRRRFICVP